MKKLILISVVFLMAGIAFGQTIKKGAVIGIHTYTYTLNPDVTLNQFIDFMMNKYIPEADKNYPGTKMYVLSGDRGEKKNQIALMTVFESIQVRDKYYPGPDKNSPEATTAEEKMKPITDQMMKFIVDYNPIYTDWIIK